MFQCRRKIWNWSLEFWIHYLLQKHRSIQPDLMENFLCFVALILFINFSTFNISTTCYKYLSTVQWVVIPCLPVWKQLSAVLFSFHLLLLCRGHNTEKEFLYQLLWQLFHFWSVPQIYCHFQILTCWVLNSVVLSISFVAGICVTCQN